MHRPAQDCAKIRSKVKIITKTEGFGWMFEAAHGNTRCEEPTVQYGVHIEDFTIGDIRSRC